LHIAMNRKYFWTTKLSLIAVLVAHNAVGLTPCRKNFVTVAQTSTPSSDNGPVKLTVTVLNERDNRTALATGLKQSDFAIFSDGVRQDIAYFSDKDEPASIAILVDTSGSMMPDRTSVSRLSFIKEAFTNFMRLSDSANEYILLSFSNSPRLLMEWTRDTNAVLTELARLASDKPKGSTAFYEACHQDDGKWRRIKIKVTPATNAPRELKRLSVRHREGYFASISRQ
jgi:Mg-chelatase subunit ChlD